MHWTQRLSPAQKAEWLKNMRLGIKRARRISKSVATKRKYTLPIPTPAVTEVTTGATQRSITASQWQDLITQQLGQRGAKDLAIQILVADNS